MITLTEEDKKRIMEWLNQKCGQMRCTCCGLGQWALVDIAVLPIGVDLHSTRFFYHQGVPQVSIACQNCGHMLFFNAGIMGFKPDIPKPGEVPREKGTT